jgi:hypothetical protein
LQEEVENRTVNLAVSTTKLTARTLVRALRWYLMHRGQKRLRKQMQHPHEEGKQSVNDLLKSGVSTDKIELPDGSARRFCKTAKKLGVDYAIRKDKTSKPARYMVFFKAKDTEVLSQVVKEFEAKNNEKQKKQSVREQLRVEKQKANEKAKKLKDKSKKVKKRKERTTGR